MKPKIVLNMSYIAYRSFQDMNNVIINNIHKFPHDIDLVVGIPRSGMLPANLIALYLNKPFTDIDSFIEGRTYDSGERGKKFDISNIKKVLIIDDSICTGGAQKKTKNKLQNLKGEYELLFGVVFATTESADKVDIFCEIIDGFRLFQWNAINHSFCSSGCWDMDGVLCLDPPVDDDGEQYLEYIKNAIPLFIPTNEIDTIVTCRLEKYREVTENWLKRNNVKYKNLIMLPFKTKEERVAWGKHGEYKGEYFKNRKDCPIFIESSKEQANIISKISGKPVFCIETFNIVNSEREKIKKGLNRFLPKPVYNLIKTVYIKLNKN